MDTRYTYVLLSVIYTVPKAFAQTIYSCKMSLSSCIIGGGGGGGGEGGRGRATNTVHMLY
jgi:hypothetical protein